MKKPSPAIAALCTIAFLAFQGCSEESLQARGFALPQGNADAGQAAFVRLQCQQCHSIAGTDLPAFDNDIASLDIELGGEVTTVQTYGDLVTSVINPSHRLKVEPDQVVAVDGESQMTVFNDVMTVTDLVNIVTFLQPKYKVVIPPVAYPAYRY